MLKLWDQRFTSGNGIYASVIIQIEICETSYQSLNIIFLNKALVVCLFVLLPELILCNHLKSNRKIPLAFCQRYTEQDKVIRPPAFKWLTHCTSQCP